MEKAIIQILEKPKSSERKNFKKKFRRSKIMNKMAKDIISIKS